MFILCTVTDTVRVLPADLSRSPTDAVSVVLDSSYIDHVVPDVGLFVTIYDILSIEGGFIYPSEGSSTFEVKFRAVVFRPLAGEIIVGKLIKSDSEGLKVSLDFFDDVTIPEHNLPEPSYFSQEEGLWYWDAGEQQLFIELNEPVRFAVKEVVFKPVPTTAALQATGATPIPSSTAPLREPLPASCIFEEMVAGYVLGDLSNGAALRQCGAETGLGTPKKPYVPMEVIGTMEKEGLGCLSWWED